MTPEVQPSKTGTILTISIVAVGLLLFSSQLASQGKKSHAAPDGEKLYKQYCAECHVAGGNKVKPSKSVCGSKKLATLATFKAYLESPVGHMPYYSEISHDNEVLKALYKYCQKLCKEPRQQASL